MQEEMKNFMTDLIWLIQEKYNQSLLETEEETLEDKSFRLGSNLAYYDVLNLVQCQLDAFGFNLKK